MKHLTKEEKNRAAKNLGTTPERLEQLINEKIQEITQTKIAKWKAQGKTHISRSTFNKAVNKAADEIISKALSK